eukprot:scaffold19011_cov32-Tisochrysis_lutea.AAC.3
MGCGTGRWSARLAARSGTGSVWLGVFVQDIDANMNIITSSTLFSIPIPILQRVSGVGGWFSNSRESWGAGGVPVAIREEE